jgi:hypothetical protein
MTSGRIGERDSEQSFPAGGASGENHRQGACVKDGDIAWVDLKNPKVDII